MAVYVPKDETEEGAWGSNSNPFWHMESVYKALMAGWEGEQRIGPEYWMDYLDREAKFNRHIRRMNKLCGDGVVDCSLEMCEEQS